MTVRAGWEWDGSPIREDPNGRKYYQRVRQILPTGVRRVFRLGDTVCLAVDDDDESISWVAQLVQMSMEPSDDLEPIFSAEVAAKLSQSTAGGNVSGDVEASVDTDDDDDKLDELYSRMRLIVRWFYAYSDVPQETIKQREPADVPAKKTEYYFTDHVESEPNSVDIITGRAHIFQSESEQKRFSLACSTGMFKKNQYIAESDKILVCKWYCGIGVEKYANRVAPMRLMRDGELEHLLANPTRKPCFELSVPAQTEKERARKGSNPENDTVPKTEDTVASLNRQASTKKVKDLPSKAKKKEAEPVSDDNNAPVALGKRKADDTVEQIRKENALKLRKRLQSIDSSITSNIARVSQRNTAKEASKELARKDNKTPTAGEGTPVVSAPESNGNLVDRKASNVPEIFPAKKDKPASRSDVGSSNIDESTSRKSKAKFLAGDVAKRKGDDESNITEAEKTKRNSFNAAHASCLNEEQRAILRRLDGPMNTIGVNEVTSLTPIIWNILSMELERSTRAAGYFDISAVDDENLWQDLAAHVNRVLDLDSGTLRHGVDTE